MKDKLPNEIVWRKDKTGFEPPQEQWMENEKIKDLIRDAKKILVDEKILKPK
jgi:asparagine synthase (glutamine-hydrolysing)